MFKRFLVVSVVAGAGCGPAWQVCTANCPSVSGSYAVQTDSLNGECAFQPYLLGPTVALAQQEAQVSTALIDPTTPFPLSLEGNVLVTPANSQDAVAEVQMQAQSARAISSNAAALDTFELRFQASLLAGGVLSGSLSTSSLGQSGSDPACVVNEQFSARWMGP
jgi:hypothetical protein